MPPAEEALSEEERAEIDRRLERLERRRAQIGPVNPLAEREYDEAREHVEALQAQREDTERAMRELESLIRDIDDEIERAFEETFEATAKNFEEMVEHLFPGGRGRLRRVSLRPVRDDERPAGEQEAPSDDAEPEPEEEEEERDEFGVEIEVTPAGKSTRKLSLLSGGEKSLVALAFVFAVFLARPCPFYILDEVEAALDDANIDRFLQLIRRFSDRAQFVIVTHQKRTMDAADVLYGVSMGGDGVTKVVSPQAAARRASEDERATRTRARTAARPSPPSPEHAHRRGRLTALARPSSDGANLLAGREEMAQRHMDRLTSFDTSFLANEKANAHMAIGAVLVCDGAPPSRRGVPRPASAAACTCCRACASACSYPPLGLGTPFWVDHAEFDVHHHVSRATLPAPGTDDRVPRASSASCWRRRSTARKPLWELTLVEGFADERFAIVYKTHHAMADGISAVDIGMLLFDVEPTTEPAAPRQPVAPAAARRRGAALVGRAATGVVGHPAPARCAGWPAPPATRPTPRAAPATASSASGR